MNVEFLSVADKEFSDAIRYYNRQREGLGEEFASEVKRTIERILQFPKAWSPLSQHTRRCMTNKFPYGIIYQVRSDFILIVAIMHLHREPEIWRKRVTRQ